MHHASSRTIAAAISLMASSILVLFLVSAAAVHAGQPNYLRQGLPDTTLVVPPVDTTIDPFKSARSGVSVYVHGDDGRLLSDADVRVLSLLGDTTLPVPFDTVRWTYRFRTNWVKDFQEYDDAFFTGLASHRYKKLVISRDGYQTQEYYLNESCNVRQGRIDIYLARPGELLYCDGCQWIPFAPRRDIAYVEFIWSDARHAKLNRRLLKELGLNVERSYPALDIRDTAAKKRGIRSRIGSNGVVVRKADGTSFRAEGDMVLARLRRDTLVRSAGMVRRMSDERVDAYDHRLYLMISYIEDALLQTDTASVDSLLRAMGAREIRRSSGRGPFVVAFDPGLGEGILDIIAALRTSRLFALIRNSDVGTLSHLYASEYPSSRQHRKSIPPQKVSPQRDPPASRAGDSSAVRPDTAIRIVQVRVVGDSGESLHPVVVRAYRSLRAVPENSLPVSYDSSRALYQVEYRPAGWGWITAWTPGRARQVRPLSESILSEATDGVLTLRLYRLGPEREVTSRPDWVGIHYREWRLPQVETLLNKLGLRVVGDLELEKTARGYVPFEPDPFRSYGRQITIREAQLIAVARLDGLPFARYDSPELRALRADTNIIFAGPTTGSSPFYIGMYDHRIVVSLEEHLHNSDEISKVLRALQIYGYPIEERKPRYGMKESNRKYTLTLPEGMGEGVKELLGRLSMVEGVDFAAKNYYELEGWYEEAE